MRRLRQRPRKLPFIVVSHGTGGTSMDLSWLCAGLAARGYIVASVDHPGNNALEAPTVAGNSVWWLRADDLSRVIDGVLNIPRFGARVDRDRIGAAGFSLGGYTVLAVAGARGDDRLLGAYCARKPSTPVCSGAATPTMPDVAAKAAALATSDPNFRAAMAANMTSHRDSRVKAVFSIAPALGPAIIPESLAAIDVPVAVVAGMGDPIVPVLDNAIPDALGIPNAELTLFPESRGPLLVSDGLCACGAHAVRRDLRRRRPRPNGAASCDDRSRGGLLRSNVARRAVTISYRTLSRDSLRILRFG